MTNVYDFRTQIKWKSFDTVQTVNNIIFQQLDCSYQNCKAQGYNDALPNDLCHRLSVNESGLYPDQGYNSNKLLINWLTIHRLPSGTVPNTALGGHFRCKQHRCAELSWLLAEPHLWWKRNCSSCCYPWVCHPTNPNLTLTKHEKAATFLGGCRWNSTCEDSSDQLSGLGQDLTEAEEGLDVMSSPCVMPG